jgi:tape measure domain-containing protein
MAEKVVYELSLNDLLSGKVKEAEGTVKSLEHSLKDVALAVGVAFGVHEIINFGKEVLHATAEFEGFTNVIKYASIDAEDGQKNLDYLAESVKRLHLPMKQAYEQFSELQGGLYGTGVEGDKLRNVFEGVATASTVLHMSADQFSRTGYAIKEIGELGTLQTRQMRMLAMALPGAMNLAAESMGMSTKKFHEAMQGGEITANKFLTNFSAKLKEHFEGGLKNASTSLMANINDMDTAIFKFKTQLGEDLKPMFIVIMQGVIDFTGQLHNLWEWIKKNQDTIVPLAKTVGSLWFAFKGASILSSVSAGLSALIPVLTGAGAATTAFGETLTLALGPVGLLVAALGTLAYAYFDTMNAQQAMAEKNASFLEKVSKDETTMLDERVTALEKGGRSHTEALKTALNNDLEAINTAVVPMIDKWKQYQSFLEHGRYEGWANPLQGVDVDKFRKDIDILEARQTSALNYKGKVAVGKGKGAVEGEPTKDLAPKGATGQKVVTINISIAKMIETFKISTANIQESSSKVRELVAQTLLSAVNDSQITAGI